MCHLPTSRNSGEEIGGLRSKEGAALQNKSLMGWESRKPERKRQEEGDKKRKKNWQMMVILLPIWNSSCSLISLLFVHEMPNPPQKLRCSKTVSKLWRLCPTGAWSSHNSAHWIIEGEVISVELGCWWWSKLKTITHWFSQTPNARKVSHRA